MLFSFRKIYVFFLRVASDVSKCTQQFAPVLKFSSCRFLHATFLLLILLSVLVSILLQIVYSFSDLLCFSSSYATFYYYISPPSVFLLFTLFYSYSLSVNLLHCPLQPRQFSPFRNISRYACVCVCVCVLCAHVLRVAVPCC